jgi:hypothetical protein
MPTTTTTYSFNKPVVGADEDDWGGYLNGNWDSVDDLLDGTTPVTGIDINSGTLDGVTIGGTTAGAGTFTTLTANTSITGTLATAAQPNITSVGTLTGLTVSASASLAGASTTADITFGDNDKAIFGAGSDLQIYSDGTTGQITGDLNITGTLTSDGLTVESTGEAAALFKGYTSVTGVDGVNNGEILLGNNASFQGRISYEGQTNGVLYIENSYNNDAADILFRSKSSGTAQNKLLIDGNGDISFYEDTGTTAKFFWDASAESLVLSNSAGTDYNNGALKIGSGEGVGDRLLTLGTNSAGEYSYLQAVKIGNQYNSLSLNPNGGNVGIGTSSPSVPLHVNGRVRVDGGSNDLDLYHNGSVAYIETTGGSATPIGFANSGSERMRIDSSGRVGIGTSSPDAQLDIEHATQAVLRLNHTPSNYWELQNDSNLKFNRGGSEAMRIDSSGNLLVGKTSAAYGTAGIRIDGRGFTQNTRDGDITAYYNRLTSDGTIVEFAKDGTTVGSIGTSGGTIYIGKDDTTLRFDSGATPSIKPSGTDGATLDATTDLGDASNRWKDLYLSGGVLDGTTTGYSFISGGSATNNGSNIFVYGGSHASNANTTIFRNGSSETMRIDSNGNFLLGTTNLALYQANNDSTADNGFVWYEQFGFGTFSRNDNNPLILNRTGTDGDILLLRKGGSNVGSIGNYSTSGIYLDAPSTLRFSQSGGTGSTTRTLRFANFSDGSSGYFGPNNDADSDAGISLGTSDGRWSDLYLSGGVYLGGTGSANKLDDYETGTWTPAITGASTNPSVTYTNAFGVYVKTGEMVHVSFKINTASFSGGSGAMLISNLPFASYSANSLYRMIGVIAFSRDIPNNGGPLLINGGSNLTEFNIYRNTNSDDFDTALLVTDVTSGTVTLHGSLTYRSQ